MSPAILSGITVLVDDGLSASSIDRWTSLEIGRHKDVEVIALVGRESSLCIQPWMPKFAYCVFLGVIPGFRGGTIVWCLFCAMWLLYVSVLWR